MYISRWQGQIRPKCTYKIDEKAVFVCTPVSDHCAAPVKRQPYRYGKEIIFDSEQSFVNEYKKKDYDVIDVTDDVIISKAPDFLLSWMV